MHILSHYWVFLAEGSCVVGLFSDWGCKQTRSIFRLKQNLSNTFHVPDTVLILQLWLSCNSFQQHCEVDINIPILQKQHWYSEKLCSFSKTSSKNLIPGWRCMLFDFKSHYLFHAILEKVLQACQILWNSSSLPAENQQALEIKWVWCSTAVSHVNEAGKWIM